MNVLHVKYAVEVAQTGSINKAAEKMFVAQPNLSRCIKELESDIGISIFERTTRGMRLTPDGEEFIARARKVLDQIDDIERLYKGELDRKKRFSITVPRSSYISYAFKEFSKSLSKEPSEVYYMESNSSQAIRNILENDYKLGIVRYAAEYDKYFKNTFEEKGLSYELVAEFRYAMIMSSKSELAKKTDLQLSDLKDYTEIIHGDPYVPSVPVELVRKQKLPYDVKGHIYLFERGGQFDILSDNPDTFMWVSPVPAELLSRYDLVQRKIGENNELYRDVLIKKKDYSLTDLDREFITELCNSKRRTAY
ncbi:MAG: LysR family transcriptional regulator [Eubacteriales bacterium]|nr:LysR family transcriptional regulator [Eubacteriales bacterium]